MGDWDDRLFARLSSPINNRTCSLHLPSLLVTQLELGYSFALRWVVDIAITSFLVKIVGTEESLLAHSRACAFPIQCPRSPTKLLIFSVDGVLQVQIQGT